MVGADDQGWTGDSAESFLYAPAHNGIEAGEVSTFVVSCPAFAHFAPQVGLCGFGEQPVAECLADGIQAEHAGQAPALGPLPIVIGAAHLDLGRAVDDTQALEQLRLVDRQLKGDHPAHRQADHMGSGQLQVFDQRHQVCGKAGDAVALPGFVGAPVTAHIQQHQAVMSGQHGDLQFPILATGAQAVDQDQWHAVAIFLVMQGATFMFEIGHG